MLPDRICRISNILGHGVEGELSGEALCTRRRLLVTLGLTGSEMRNWSSGYARHRLPGPGEDFLWMTGWMGWCFQNLDLDSKLLRMFILCFLVSLAPEPQPLARIFNLVPSRL